MARLGRLIAGALIAAGLGACSGTSGSEGASSSFITGSVFSSAPKTPPPVDVPANRPVKVAMNSAAAVKCGFYFDTAKLRQSFLASHVATVPGSDPAKVQKDYDTSFARATAALGGQSDFCTPTEVGFLKADLKRYLAGDFATVARVEKGPKQLSAWEYFMDGGSNAGKMDVNEVFFPSGGAQTVGR